jgi:hypothetical protein
VSGPRPCPRSGGSALKALFVGLCVLFVMTQAAAAANLQHSAVAHRAAVESTTAKATLPLEQKLALKVAAARKHRSTVRFFQAHQSLLRSADDRPAALVAFARAKRALARVTKEIRHYERRIHARDAQRRTRRLTTAPPRDAICGVFGRYCRQALAVAWCESGHQTTARNGQYVGLFQMGDWARAYAGHGDTAYEQAVAAYKLFVRTGRDWSPWSCRWAAS